MKKLLRDRSYSFSENEQTDRVGDFTPAVREELRNALCAATRDVPGITADEIECRAKWVEEDFGMMKIVPKFNETRCPTNTPEGRQILRIISYSFGENECDIKNARYGDRKHTSMSGCGLNRESLLYFSKISKMGHKRIPKIWPGKMIKELRDPNKHLNILNEVWWLGKFRSGFVDWPSVRRNVKLHLPNTEKKDTNVDWVFPVSTGLSRMTLRVEVKRRIGDINRRTYGSNLRSDLFQEIEEKFPDIRGTDEFNVCCLRLYGGITPDVRLETKAWLETQKKIDAVCLASVSTDERDSFCVMTRAGAEFIKQLVEPPDHEDQMYVGVYAFPCTIEGLQIAGNTPEYTKKS